MNYALLLISSLILWFAVRMLELRIGLKRQRALRERGPGIDLIGPVNGKNGR